MGPGGAACSRRPCGGGDGPLRRTFGPFASLETLIYDLPANGTAGSIVARGLDVGSAGVTAAHLVGDRVHYLEQPGLALEVDSADRARRVLGRSDLRWVGDGKDGRQGRGHLLGDDAAAFSKASGAPARSLVRDGVLTKSDKRSLPLLAHLVDDVLGPPRRAGEPVAYSVPADPADAPRECAYHRKVLRHIVKEAGFEPVPVHPGMAVVYELLSDEDFTGLGVAWGPTMTHVCVGYHAVPLVQLTVCRGTNGVHEGKSGRAGAAEGTGGATDPATRADALVDHLALHLARLSARRNLADGLDLVVATAGRRDPTGNADADAVLERLDDRLLGRLDRADLPFSVRDVRQSAHPAFGVVKGDLVAALARDGRQGGLTDVTEAAARA